jgi:hypothetical protein
MSLKLDPITSYLCQGNAMERDMLLPKLQTIVLVILSLSFSLLISILKNK